MKKMLLLMLMCIMLTPIGARAQQRNWWPEQICEEDELYDFQKIGEWPGDVLTKETAIDTILFRPKVAARNEWIRSNNSRYLALGGSNLDCGSGNTVR